MDTPLEINLFIYTSTVATRDKKYLSHSSPPSAWVSQYLLSVPPTQTHSQIKEWERSHCQAAMGQYSNAQSVGEEASSAVSIEPLFTEKWVEPLK